jgi:hypothetical protein
MTFLPGVTLLVNVMEHSLNEDQKYIQPIVQYISYSWQDLLGWYFLHKMLWHDDRKPE